MGQCAAPCNLSVSEDAYGDQVRRAITFLRGRAAPILGELARGRDQAAAAMRFEEARRFHRDLEALTALTERVGTAQPGDRGEQSCNRDRTPAPRPPRQTGLQCRCKRRVRHSQRAAGADPRARFAGGRRGSRRVSSRSNYERYRLRAVTRDELEPMMIVARWLKERASHDGRLIHLDGPSVDVGDYCARLAPRHRAAGQAASRSAAFSRWREGRNRVVLRGGRASPDGRRDRTACAPSFPHARDSPASIS